MSPSALAEQLVDAGYEAIIAHGVWYQSVTGRVVPYDTAADVGWFTESFGRGAFTASLTRNQNVPLLLFHDNRTFPVGRAEVWTDDTTGLYATFSLAATAEAQRAGYHAHAGELGLSVGFQPERSTWRHPKVWDPDAGPEHMDHVTRQQARLLEVSLTPTPAYESAQVLHVEAAQLDAAAD
jgi:hypothetical protein